VQSRHSSVGSLTGARLRRKHRHKYTGVVASPQPIRCLLAISPRLSARTRARPVSSWAGSMPARLLHSFAPSQSCDASSPSSIRPSPPPPSFQNTRICDAVHLPVWTAVFAKAVQVLAVPHGAGACVGGSAVALPLNTPAPSGRLA